MLEKVKADWRRGRALKYIRVGEHFTYEYDTPGGPIMLVGRFDADGETLVVKFHEIYAKDVLEKGQYQADMGVPHIRDWLEWVAGMAGDLGYTRLRAGGRRTKGKRGYQNFEFPLDRYLRGQRPRR